MATASAPTAWGTSTSRGLHRPPGGGQRWAPDAFVSKYDATGNLLWTEQLGTASDDGSHGVSADGLGNVYISGEPMATSVAPMQATSTRL